MTKTLIPMRGSDDVGETWWQCVICKGWHQPDKIKNPREIQFLVCSRECRAAYVQQLADAVRDVEDLIGPLG